MQLQIAQVEAELGKALAGLERAVGRQINERPAPALEHMPAPALSPSPAGTTKPVSRRRIPHDAARP